MPTVDPERLHDLIDDLVLIRLVPRVLRQLLLIEIGPLPLQWIREVRWRREQIVERRRRVSERVVHLVRARPVAGACPFHDRTSIEWRHAQRDQLRISVVDILQMLIAASPDRVDGAEAQLHVPQATVDALVHVAGIAGHLGHLADDRAQPLGLSAAGLR